ncbi:M20/M25/M40 family metallo-hydrolase [Streptomyces sp. NPDC059080]|uniref:M20/M25/M40 family metallo-hydrolase n=1 Tax=Streptomyces sp. NPDC059080 TaxID=3346718 RepID=UPI0036876F4F
MNELDLRARVKSIMGDLTAHLTALVKIPSVYSPTDLKSVRDAADAIRTLLQGYGFKDARLIELGDKDAPLVYATHTASSKAPTVLLYAHYDVVQPDASWPDAFKPYVDETTHRMHGRGAADDKSGVVMHLGVAHAFNGDVPVNLKIVMEGEEESGRGTLEEYVPAHRDLFTADVIVVADTGNYRLGKPTLTTSLRGLAAVDVTVTTLDSPKHSGMYGGPAPDAFVVLARMIARLHDAAGNVAVPGLDHSIWKGHEPTEEEFRTDAGVREGVKLIGTDSLGSRLYVKPSINVVGLDGPPPWAKPINQLQGTAKARISMRIAPQQDPKTAIKLLADYLRRSDVNEWNAIVEVEPAGTGEGFTADTSQPGYKSAADALEYAYLGEKTAFAGQGGSIPLVSVLQQINPQASVLLLGCEEPLCHIHASHESVSLDELESMTLAQCRLLQQLGNATVAEQTGTGII